ncbi:hypothetical protein P153DRAFT_376854 [Dothidotthia symphoricarpi CBS 119687]|uniref:LisH domain-containing protein n=1 Tax=Dothidotthia symphoricarpi CBS 119687 TaxID=1392245 RepID=A0A6A6AA17_9PLEO|nr:uncharacterized protein P153DRAFT_376854 [Dothidotthia symphoricarpi CBS 119687]KAF2127924.1 hypothetical protein P153DRAFT_376854 [Dothidotthia symphoricarpi CBS 119687]
MAAMSVNGGPDGTPVMGNMARPQRPPMDPREQLNTYIYDYFLRNKHVRLARAMVECDMKMATSPPLKPSPNNRANGVDAMDESADDLPNPQLPKGQLADDSFLLDWWVQFWDIYQATSIRGLNSKSSQYIAHTRNLTQMQNDQRNSRMLMTNPMNAQYQNMMRSNMANGVASNDLKRAAAMNSRNPNANPMANMGQMKNPAMMAAHMQRDGSGMGINGQNPQSPGSNDNAPSPNKRARVEGGMIAGNMPGGQFNEFAQQAQHAQQKNIEVYAQSLANQHRVALNNTASPQAMNSGAQGSPMNQQGLDGQHDMFAGNPSRPGPGMPANAPGAPPQGNHALQDYQMQLMLLEQQNKKRLLMARQEQDNMSGPNQHAVGGPGFAPNMSPQGSRAGPSPNPADQIKRGTPKLNQQGLPTSPMPEGVMPQRNSPAPNMNFDPQLAPPGMPPQFFPMGAQNNPMMRPPSSHPGPFVNGQQLTQQQMEAAMRAAGPMPNGVWRGPPQPGMMPQQPMGVMGQNPQRIQMPPPPAPTNEPPRPEPSPSQSNQAPPTPNQGNKAGPKKKGGKDNKKPTNKKGGNTGATPVASAGEEAPTPTASTPVAPITPQHKQSFNQGPNGQPQQQPLPLQQQPMDNNIPPFGNIEDPNSLDLGFNFTDDSGALENFDFDSFLHTDDAGGGGFGLGAEFDFGNPVEAGGGEL